MEANDNDNDKASLSLRLDQFVNPRPQFVDPEDDLDFETSARNIGSGWEEGRLPSDGLSVSKLRQHSAPLLADVDKRYKGKRVTRRQLEARTSSDEDVEDEDISDYDENFEQRKGLKKAKKVTFAESEGLEDENESDPRDSPDGSSMSGEEEGEGENEDDDEEGDETTTRSVKDAVKSDESAEDYTVKFSNIDVEDDVVKGQAVKNQLIIWDNLLEWRIRLQKLLLSANKLPQHDVWPLFSGQRNKEFNDSRRKAVKQVKNLLNSFLDLEAALNAQNPTLFKEGKLNDIVDDGDEEIPSDSDEGQEKSEEEEEEGDVLEDVSNDTSRKRRWNDSNMGSLLEKRHETFKKVRNEVIDQWYNKTRFATIAGGGKLNPKTSLEAFEQSPLKQIEQIISNKSRLVKRTQLKRSQYTILGKADQAEEKTSTDDNDSYDPQIFDDDDFYHQLLRELIENKSSGDSSDPIAMSRKWLEIQKLRSKMKRKVDTKASKGRKIKHDVVKQLVNFMAPFDDSEYTDQAKDELYRSLFGKRPYQ